MVNSRNQEVITLEGTVLRKFPVEHGVGKTGKNYSKNKFILKTLDGRDLYITKFGEFNSEYIGKDVRFEASRYNDTNYTVCGELEDAGDLVGAAVAPTVVNESTTTTTTTRRRGRPSKAVVTPTETPTSTTNRILSGGSRTGKSTTNSPVHEAPSYQAPTENESLEAIAHSVVLNNLKRAETLLIGLHRPDYTTSDIIAVGDMLGRTYVSLRIEQNKDRRMDSFNKR